MEKSLFTIVIPLYNKASTIKRTIDSLLSQTFKDFDVIIVDDGSEDNALEIVNSYKSDRIKLVSEENQGVSSARNKGIELSKTEFITFLDADDEYSKEHLEKLKHLIDNYPNYNVYATSYKIVTNEKESLPLIQNLKFKESKDVNEGVVESYFEVASKGHCPIHIGSIAVRRQALKNIQFPLRVAVGEDLYFIALLMIKNDLVFLNDASYIYNFEETNRFMGLYEQIDMYFDSLLDRGCKDKYLKSYVALWHTRRAIYALRTKSWNVIRHHLLKSLKIEPFQTKIYTAFLSAIKEQLKQITFFK